MGYYFRIYGFDKTYQKGEVNFYAEMSEDIPLLEKVKIIAEKLSRFRYSGIPIEVLEIYTDDKNNKIALVNLLEREWNRNPKNKIVGTTWRSHYFQGSSGGSETTYTLRNSFLQKEYPGEWIDGVKFLYENQPIGNDWDHISLSGVIYRSSVQ